VRQYHRGTKYNDLEQAITGAIDRCIEEGVLKEFLMEHRAEVVKMTQLDYTFERRIMLAKRDSREEGREEGIDEGELKNLIFLISKKKAKHCTISETADMLETEEALVEKVYDALETYDAETQWEDIIKLIK
jgi:predicted transposase YdaD